VKRKPYSGISLLFSKLSKGPSGLTSASDGRIGIDNTYAFTSFALWRDLRTQVYLEQKLAIEVLLHNPS
jgi:hypothetical protein